MRLIAIFTCALFLVGCADQRAVRDISMRLTNATSTWNDVGTELTESCLREAMLNPALSNCDSERRATDGVIAVNKVLSNYFKALSDAASDSNFTIQPGLDAVTKSVAEIPDIKKERVDAISGLAGLLVRLGTKAMREYTLRQLINEGVPNAKSVIEGLSEVVAKPLLKRLDEEKNQVNSIYAKNITLQKDIFDKDMDKLCNEPIAASFSGTGFLLAQDYCRRVSVIKVRENAVVTYEESLKEANEALNKLQSANLNTKELAEQLSKIGSDLDSKIDAVKKAYN